jgi:polysaccharide chain length determinant protein (PEP-CTERM system associated)
MDKLLEQLIGHARAIWLRRFWGLGAAWLVAVIGLAVALLLPPQYEATAQVYVDTESVLKPLMQGLAIQPNVDQQVDVLSRTLLSRPNMERLVHSAQLDGGASDDAARNLIIERVARTLQFAAVRDARGQRTNLFTLSYRSADPASAKRVIESLLAIFVESGLTNKRRDTDKARQFLDRQIEEYEQVLTEAERRLKQFKLQNFEHLGSAQDSVGGMLTLDTEIDKARTELRAAEQRRDAVRRQLDSEVPLFVSQQVDSRREILQRNLDELRMKYTEEHPDVVNARNLLEDFDQQRLATMQGRPGADGRIPGGASGQPNIAYQQLKVSLAEAEGNVAELRSRLRGLEERYSRVRSSAKLKPELEEQLAQLNREYQVQKTNFEQLVARRESAKLTGELDESAGVDFRVIDPPRVSDTPVAPDRLRIVLIVFALSAAAGVAVSYAASQMFPTVSSARELAALAHRPVLGSIAYQVTSSVSIGRTRRNVMFAGALTGLGALFGVAMALVLLVGRLG